MLISLNKWKWLRIYFKKAYDEKIIYWKDICCRYALELPHGGNSNVYLQHNYVTENKEETYLEFTFSKYHVHCLNLF